MDTVEITESMKECLEMLNKHGELIRLKGGFWTYAACRTKLETYRGELYSVPVKYFKWATINALLKNNLIQVAEKKFSKINKGMFAIKVKPV